MSRALPTPPSGDPRGESNEPQRFQGQSKHSQPETQSAARLGLEKELLELSFQRWIDVGPDTEDDELSPSSEFPWLASWEKDSCYDGETLRLVGSQRSGLSDKTVTLVRLTDYWRKSVEKLVVQKQSLMRWLEGTKW